MNETARAVAVKQRLSATSAAETQVEGAEGDESQKQDDTAVRRGSLFRAQSKDKWREKSMTKLQTSMQKQMVFLTENERNEVEKQQSIGSDKSIISVLSEAERANLLTANTTTNWNESDIEEMERDLKEQIDTERDRASKCDTDAQKERV